MNRTPGRVPEHEARRILDQRASALAKPYREAVDKGAIKVLAIRIEDEHYGVDVRHLLEVQPLESLTPVPGLPSIWAGLISLRGVLYPVLDLARYLGLERGPRDVAQHVVVVSSETLVVCLLVDDVVGFRSIASDDVEPPLDVAGQLRRAAVSGMTADLLLLLDVEALLQDPSLVVDEEGAQKGV